ncbi:MAG: SDR family NAD(P)-dependent oxidoreductase [Alphaproteobacteria bacterium]
MKRFADRVVLVTGAASGIGRAVAERLAAEGARLHALDVQDEALAGLGASLRAEGAEVETGRCDVSDEAQVDASVAGCVARFGRLDALVNVAAILRADLLHELRTEDWNRVLAVNLSGTFYACRAALPHLLESRGNIVNVASTAAVHGQPYAGAYAASKGGVLALTKSIAIDYARQGVRANAVLPCDIATPIFGQFQMPEGGDWKLVKRVMAPRGSGAPADVAGVVAMLASDDGAHVTGAEVRVDGGCFA